MPQFSPDGKSVAFFEDRGDLRVIDIKTKAVHTAMDGKYIYSYSDGDIWFEWSPDSKWLLSAYIGNGGWNNRDIALVNAAGTGIGRSKGTKRAIVTLREGTIDIFGDVTK